MKSLNRIQTIKVVQLYGHWSNNFKINDVNIVPALSWTMLVKRGLAIKFG